MSVELNQHTPKEKTVAAQQPPCIQNRKINAPMTHKTSEGRKNISLMHDA